MGACSGKPKTAEFEGIVKLYPHGSQIGSEKKFLDDGCEERFNIVEVNQQKLITIEHSPQNYSPVEGMHIYVRDTLLVSKTKSLAETSPGHSRETIINEDCDAKRKHLAALGEPQLMPSTEKIDNALKFQEEKAQMQNPIPFSRGTSDMGDSKEVKIEKSQTQDEPEKPSNAAKIYDLKDVSDMHSALIISKTHDSEWTTLDFTTFSSNSSPKKKGIDTFSAESPVSSQPHPKVETDVRVVEDSMVERSSDTGFSSAYQSPAPHNQLQLQKMHVTSNMSNGLQLHLQNSTNPLPAVAVGNFQMGDVQGASPGFANIGVDSEGARGSACCPMIPEAHDETQVVLKKQGSSASFLDFSVTDQISCASQIKLNNIPQQDYASKQVMQVIEPVDPMDMNKPDIITDIDQMLEKLASEFERQESLCSFSVSCVAQT